MSASLGRRRARGSRAGFTLIELLTVIAIIGILAAILIPTVTAVRKRARAAGCVSILREWARSFQLYAQDNKGNYVITGKAVSNPTGPTLWWCDSGSNFDVERGHYNKYWNHASISWDNKFCPLQEPGVKSGAYGNSNLYAGYVAIVGRPTLTSNTLNLSYAVPLHKVQTPSKWMMLIDSVKEGKSGRIWRKSDYDTFAKPLLDGTAQAPDADRHPTGLNAVFGDGHVQKVVYDSGNPSDPNSIAAMGDIWTSLSH